MYINIVYPTNLEKNYSSYILLTGRQWGTVYRKNKTAKHQSLRHEIYITLPMPSNGLTDTTTHNWEGAEGALLNISVKNAPKIIMRALLNKGKSLLGRMSASQEFVSGITVNDYAALKYTGQGFRQFEFEFEMIPNNRQDALKINQIIEALKIGSLPQNEGPLIQYPFFWEVDILKPNGETYFQIKKSVLNNLNVNRFTEGANIHSDGEPIKTLISIGLSEIEKQWRNDYNQK